MGSIGSRVIRVYAGQMVENGVNELTQLAGALAVNDAHGEDIFFTAGLKIIGHKFLHVPGGERVEIEGAVYRNLSGFGFVHKGWAGKLAGGKIRSCSGKVKGQA